MHETKISFYYYQFVKYLQKYENILQISKETFPAFSWEDKYKLEILPKFARDSRLRQVQERLIVVLSTHSALMSGRSCTSIDDRTNFGSLLGAGGYRKRLLLSYNSPFHLFSVFRDPEAGRHVEEAQKRRRRPVIDVRQPYEARPNRPRRDVDEERRFSTSNPERSYNTTVKRRTAVEEKEEEEEAERGVGGRSRRRISNWYW